MNETYVFDFYNLYIPKYANYENKELGIKIAPLRFAEEFEKNRRTYSKPYHRGGWKTAKCFIKSKTEKEAKKIASWLEFLYSFAQSRSIFFSSWYKYKSGKKYYSAESKFIQYRNNNFSELIHAVHTSKAGYTRDISLFIDTALKTLNESNCDELKKIISTIHAFEISNSQLPQELKFLTCWIALEKLANSHYTGHNSDKELFSKEELETLKSNLVKAVENILEGDDRAQLVVKSIDRNFLYQHNTWGKIMLYSDHLDLGFDREKLRKMLSNLIEVRVGLVHNLQSSSLTKKPQLLFYLQMIMENVLFRVLGINKEMQKKMLLNQYNRGNEL